MISKLKDIGVMAMVIVCSYVTLIISVALSGICIGRDEGHMAVSSCMLPGNMWISRANNGYGFLFLSLFLLFVPFVLWVAGLLRGWFYRKKLHKKTGESARIGKIAMGLVGLNAIVLITAIIMRIIVEIQ